MKYGIAMFIFWFITFLLTMLLYLFIDPGMVVIIGSLHGMLLISMMRIEQKIVVKMKKEAEQKELSKLKDAIFDGNIPA